LNLNCNLYSHSLKDTILFTLLIPFPQGEARVAGPLAFVPLIVAYVQVTTSLAAPAADVFHNFRVGARVRPGIRERPLPSSTTRGIHAVYLVANEVPQYRGETAKIGFTR
jgi:hypothetical protein